MHHGLFVAALVVGQLAGLVQLGLQQSLTEAGDVAVPEDAEAASKELALHAISLGILLTQELDDRLAHGESNRLRHVVSPSELV